MQELSLSNDYQTIHNKCTRRHHTCHNIPDTSYPVYIRPLGESPQAYIPNPAFAWKSARAAAASLGKAYNVKDIRWEMCAALTVCPASTTRHRWRECTQHVDARRKRLTWLGMPSWHPSYVLRLQPRHAKSEHLQHAVRLRKDNRACAADVQSCLRSGLCFIVNY